MMFSNKDINFFLKCANKNPDLNEWEIDFVDNITKTHEAGHALTEKQQECLEKIAMGHR